MVDFLDIGLARGLFSLGIFIWVVFWRRIFIWRFFIRRGFFLIELSPIIHLIYIVIIFFKRRCFFNPFFSTLNGLAFSSLKISLIIKLHICRLPMHLSLLINLIAIIKMIIDFTRRLFFIIQKKRIILWIKSLIIFESFWFVEGIGGSWRGFVENMIDIIGIRMIVCHYCSLNLFILYKFNSRLF